MPETAGQGFGSRMRGYSYFALKVFLVVAALFLVHLAFSLFSEKKIYSAQLLLQHVLVETTATETKNSLESLVLKEDSILQELLAVPLDTLASKEKPAPESKKFSIFLIKKLNEGFIEDIDWLLLQQQEIYGTAFPDNLSDSSPQEKLLDYMDREISLMVVFNFIYLANMETIKNLSDRENLSSFLRVEKISEGKYSFKEMDFYLHQAKGFLDENFSFMPISGYPIPKTYEFGKILAFYKKYPEWTSGDFFIDTVDYDALHFEKNPSGAGSSFYLKFEKKIDSFDYVYLVRQRLSINRRIAQYMEKYRQFLEKKFFESMSGDDEFAKFVDTQKIITLRNISRRIIDIPETKQL